MRDSEDDLEIDEKDEEMNNHFINYIGVGPAHTDAPNKQFRQEMPEEKIKTKNVLNIDGFNSESDSGSSEFPSKTSAEPIDPEQKSADIFADVDSPPLQSYETPPENFTSLAADPNLEEEDEEDEDEEYESDYFTGEKEGTTPETLSEEIKSSVEKVVIKEENVKEEVLEEEEEDIKFRSMNFTSDGGESTQQSMRKPNIKRSCDKISTSSETVPQSQEDSVKMENDSSEVVPSSQENEQEKKPLDKKAEEKRAQEEAKEKELKEQMTIWERDELSRTEAVKTLLNAAADAETCFDPDFFTSASKYPRRDSTKINYIYTHIAGVNDGEDLSSVRFYSYSHGFVVQPWLTEQDQYNPSRIIRDRSYIFGRLSDVYLTQWEDGYHVFETLFYDAKDVSLERRKTLIALRAYYREMKRLGREKEVLKTFAFIVKLAREADKCLPKKIIRLEQDKFRSVTLSQKQCAVILANMFVGMGHSDDDFSKIFRGSHPVMIEKVKFLMNYFATIQEKMPTGNVSFRRKYKMAKTKDDMTQDRTNISSLIFLVADELRIEEAAGCSQMDFANSYIGGGVLNTGSVQEEIRFMMCPEMLVSIILCDEMKKNEAIFIVGAQTYSSYNGYGGSLKWLELQKEDAALNKSVDQYGRIRNELIAVDALNFGYSRRGLEQFREDNILREINKLLVGFEFSCDTKPPVVTGWWGCGAFRGDKQLKAILQVIAATVTKRPLVFCTFGEPRTAISLQNIVRKLQENNVTVGLLFRWCLYYNVQMSRDHLSLFDFIMSCINRTKKR